MWPTILRSEIRGELWNVRYVLSVAGTEDKIATIVMVQDGTTIQTTCVKIVMVAEKFTALTVTEQER